MTIQLYNGGTDSFVVENNRVRQLVEPGKTVFLSVSSEEVEIKLLHVVKDRFNIGWYLLNELFTLEQMRTVLVVDGEYGINNACEESIIKVKSYEYVFDKNMSYQTFVFSSNKGRILRKKLEIANAEKIYKKAKFLYLFGGTKTLFPLVGFALAVSFVRLLFASTIPLWYYIMTGCEAVCFVLLFKKYRDSLNRLNTALCEASIAKYMLSDRKEYRKFSDKLIQKHLDENSGDDLYW